MVVITGGQAYFFKGDTPHPSLGLRPWITEATATCIEGHRADRVGLRASVRGGKRRDEAWTASQGTAAQDVAWCSTVERRWRREGRAGEGGHRSAWRRARAAGPVL